MNLKGKQNFKIRIAAEHTFLTKTISFIIIFNYFFIFFDVNFSHIIARSTF
jgi:hypothetical protein